MEKSKVWWQSKTIWFGLATGISGVLTAAGVLPAVIAAAHIDALVTTALTIATIVSRYVAKEELVVTKEATDA